MKKILQTRINNEQVEIAIEPRLLLSDLLREYLTLTGTHVGCSYGVCGACTVIINGKPARSCLTLAIQTENCEITTIEGLTSNSKFSDICTAFTEEHGLQCGFCTPGIVCSLLALIDSEEQVTPEQIDLVIDGHLCRCTGYVNIRKASRKAVGLPEEETTC
tara:strand:+ start:225 stop:707 length:483 start_codon:yes stop_codon:yes gene_type:complete